MSGLQDELQRTKVQYAQLLAEKESLEKVLLDQVLGPPHSTGLGFTHNVVMTKMLLTNFRCLDALLPRREEGADPDPAHQLPHTLFNRFFC